VGFPDSVLTEDERLVLHLRPHVRTVARPVLALLIALTVLIVAWVMLPTNTGGRIGVLVVAAASGTLAVTRGMWPLLAWRCTHYVFTDERIVLQEGVLSRDRRDLPLSRINDHVLSQSLVDRLLGCGTLTVDTIGERGPAVLVAVPRVRLAQNTLFDLVEDDLDRHDGEDEELDLPAR
jgi:uncharacterized membrane protein YdbT with pleckstrin-like domain